MEAVGTRVRRTTLQQHQKLQPLRLQAVVQPLPVVPMYHSGRTAAGPTAVGNKASNGRSKQLQLKRATKAKVCLCFRKAKVAKAAKAITLMTELKNCREKLLPWRMEFNNYESPSQVSERHGLIQGTN